MKKGLHIIRALYPIEPDALPPVDTYYGDASYFTASPLYDDDAKAFVDFEHGYMQALSALYTEGVKKHD